MPMHHYSLMGVLEGTGMGFGANIGLLYDVTDDFHIGFNFRTAGTIALEGTMKQDVYMPAIAIDGAGASPITSAEPDATTELPIPMEIDFGASYDVNDALTLAFGLAYTSWETLDVLTIELDGLSPSGAESDDVELQMNWENTMRLNFGLNYVAIPDLLELRTGVYLDPSAIPDESVRPSITDVADKMSISLGAAYSLSEKVTLEAYWMHLTGERTVDQTTEQTFKDNVPGDWSIQTDSFGFQFNYTF